VSVLSNEHRAAAINKWWVFDADADRGTGVVARWVKRWKAEGGRLDGWGWWVSDMRDVYVDGGA
jgi:hypothetical protein